MRNQFGPPTQITFTFGQAGDRPVVGDWDGDSVDTVGIFRPSTGQWFLRDQFGPPTQNIFTFGTTGDIPISSDWDGIGGSTPGIFRPSTGQ